MCSLHTGVKTLSRNKRSKIWVPVPDMGGFSYCFEEVGIDGKLVTDRWCRVVESRDCLTRRFCRRSAGGDRLEHLANANQDANLEFMRLALKKLILG
jgi:hypothetical protein